MHSSYTSKAEHGCWPERDGAIYCSSRSSKVFVYLKKTAESIFSVREIRFAHKMRRIPPGLLLLLGLSTFVVIQRYSAAKFGLPDMKDYDENAVAGQAGAFFRECRVLPYSGQNTFLYGSAQTYAVLAEVEVYHALARLRGTSRDRTEYPDGFFLLASRYTSLVAFLGSISLLYLIGCRASGPGVGALGILLFGTLPVATRSSLAAKADMAALLLLLATFFFTQRWLDCRRSRFLFLAAVLAVLAMKVKLTAWPATLFAPLALLAACLSDLAQRRKVTQNGLAAGRPIQRWIGILLALVGLQALVWAATEPSLILRFEDWKASVRFVLESKDPHGGATPLLQRVPQFIETIRPDFPLPLLLASAAGFLACLLGRAWSRRWLSVGVLVVVLSVLSTGVVRARYGIAVLAMMCMLPGVFVSVILHRVRLRNVRVSIWFLILCAAAFVFFVNSQMVIRSEQNPHTYAKHIIGAQRKLILEANLGSLVVMENWAPLRLPERFLRIYEGNFGLGFLQNTPFSYYVEWLSSRPPEDGLRRSRNQANAWIKGTCDHILTIPSTGRTYRTRVYRRKHNGADAEVRVPYLPMQHQLRWRRSSPILNPSFEQADTLFLDWSIGCDLWGGRLLEEEDYPGEWFFEGFGRAFSHNIKTEPTRGPLPESPALRLTGINGQTNHDLILLRQDRQIPQIYHGEKALVTDLYGCGSLSNAGFTLLTFLGTGVPPQPAQSIKTPIWRHYHGRQLLPPDARDVSLLVRLYGSDTITFQRVKISLERIDGDPMTHMQTGGADDGERSLRLIADGQKETEYARQYVPLEQLMPYGHLRLRSKVHPVTPFRDVESGVTLRTVSWGGEIIKEKKYVLLSSSDETESGEWNTFDVSLDPFKSAWAAGPSSIGWIQLEVFLRALDRSGRGTVLVDNLEVI
jgi:hypothetical protein